MSRGAFVFWLVEIALLLGALLLVYHGRADWYLIPLSVVALPVAIVALVFVFILRESAHGRNPFN